MENKGKIMNQNFGQIVRTQRHRLDLTQAELAEWASCATITIRRIEGNTLRPSRQLAEKLAEVLAIPPDEKETFISLARANPGSNEFVEEAMGANKSVISLRRTNYLLLFLPLLLILLVLVVNPNYLWTLIALQPPYVIPGVLPWGWFVMLLIAGSMWLTRRVLWHGSDTSSDHQNEPSRDWSGPVLLFLTFPTLLIILLAPAVLMVFHSGALN
jgi:DNA-binding XRE family transcriptional regulator